ncbi:MULTISPECIES: hypothetical protein [unclassified Pseudomonas]|uniref:hypothetical protein n=1 Tax=unclassified Pseudomonas TaxID=196821 RepID=UPI002E80466D|nr:MULTISPECIES: hypothetical protein [unclassified Pseudomonas]
MTEHSRRPRLLFPRLVVGVLLAGGLCAGQANAQVIVNDPMSMGKALQEYAEQAKRWTDTLKQYQQQLDHYKQQLIQLQRLNLGESTMAYNFAERPHDFGLEELPRASGSGLTGLLQQFKSLVPQYAGRRGPGTAEGLRMRGASPEHAVQRFGAHSQGLDPTQRPVSAARQRRYQPGRAGGQRQRSSTLRRAERYGLGLLAGSDEGIRQHIVGLMDNQSRLSRKALNDDKSSWLAPLGKLCKPPRWQ